MEDGGRLVHVNISLAQGEIMPKMVRTVLFGLVQVFFYSQVSTENFILVSDEAFILVHKTNNYL